MIDNTHVVVLRGSGRDMVPVPEMAAFGERFGFQFVAHAIGNANRSARVERPFHFIENNFLAGRTFRSWEDLNQRAREWCDKVNSTYKKHIRAVPRELFAVERLHLKPLPAWIPEVYRLQQRLVDIEGYVALNSNRYSVPVEWIGRRVEVRETKDKIEIQLDARRLVTHRRIAEAEHQRVMLAEHRPPRGQQRRAARSASRREGHRHRRARTGRLCRGVETAQPQGGHACPAATAAVGARVSTRTAAGSGARGRPLWALRSGPAGDG